MQCQAKSLTRDVMIGRDAPLVEGVGFERGVESERIDCQRILGADKQIRLRLRWLAYSFRLRVGVLYLRTSAMGSHLVVDAPGPRVLCGTKSAGLAEHGPHRRGVCGLDFSKRLEAVAFVEPAVVGAGGLEIRRELVAVAYFERVPE
jgi:hypothetical protein